MELWGRLGRPALSCRRSTVRTSHTDRSSRPPARILRPQSPDLVLDGYETPERGPELRLWARFWSKNFDVGKSIGRRVSLRSLQATSSMTSVHIDAHGNDIPF